MTVIYPGIYIPVFLYIYPHLSAFIRIYISCYFLSFFVISYYVKLLDLPVCFPFVRISVYRFRRLRSFCKKILKSITVLTLSISESFLLKSCKIIFIEKNICPKVCQMLLRINKLISYILKKKNNGTIDNCNKLTDHIGNTTDHKKN